MSFAALDCDRLSLTLKLTTAGGREHALERELRAALETQLAATLAPFACGRDDGARLFIEQLVVDGAVGAAWDMDVIVRHLAGRIAAAVSAEIDGGAGLRFHDRADFVAAFLAALAEGTAHSRWCFSEFAGLKALSASNAIRSVMLMDDEPGFAALARLTPEAARRVLDVLAPADAARVLAHCRGRAATARPPLQQLWKCSRMLARSPEADPREWLAVLVECERACAASAGERAVAVLESLRNLRAAASAGAFTLADPDSGETRPALREFARRMGITADWLADANDRVMADIARELSAARAAPGRDALLWTEHGGAFVLLQSLTRLGWLELWRDELDAPQVRALALAVVAEALAPAQAASLLDNEALLRAFGTAEVRGLLRHHRKRCVQALRSAGISVAAAGRRRGPASATGALGRLLAAAAGTLLAEFAARIPGLAGSSPDYLRRNVLALPAAIAIGAGGARIRPGRAPLDVLLTLSGCKRARFMLPDQWVIEFTEDLSP